MNAVINALILPLQFFKNKVSHVHQSEKKQNNKVADWECKWEKSQLFCCGGGNKIHLASCVFVIVVIVALVLYVGSVFCVFVVVLYWYRCGNVHVV